MWSAIGEVLFTVVVSYMGAIELLFVAKQLYHLAFQHQRRQMLIADDRSLRRLQDQIESELVEAAGREIHGFNAMKDGILYKDGIRIDPSEINEHGMAQRQIIGGSKSSLEDDEDRCTSEVEVKVTEKLMSDQSDQIEVCEEPCVKKHVERLTTDRQSIEKQTADDKRTNLTQTVKTQIGQTNVEDFTPPSHDAEGSRLTPRKSEEPDNATSAHSESLSPHPSSSLLAHEIQFDEYQREAPDGQDVPEHQYSDDYLRSLDGIKIRPLVRDDGSGRRRAFKKRRSSDSTSSRESRASREEELKMFTSLEEEEFESIRRGDSDYVPIRYSSDPNLIKTGRHQRRHKKSPIKDSARLETEGSKSSLEMLDEENLSPWGDVKPEHYKDSEFWKREKAISIEEESEENAQSLCDDVQKEQAEEATASLSPTKYIPKLSSFEEATPSQHENAVSTLNQEKSQDKPKDIAEKDDMENVSNDDDNSPTEHLIASCDNKTSDETEEIMPACNATDDLAEQTGLRHSPCLDDMEQYEERLLTQENEKIRSLSLSPQFNSKNLSTSQLTQVTSISEITDEQNQISSTSDNISSSLRTETLHGGSPGKLDRPKTPVIEIQSPSDDISNISTESADEIQTISEPSLLEGISDFYDFNASVNPSRSPSIERALSKSRSPSKESARKSPKLSKSEEDSVKIIPGLSDFCDFNVMLNQHATDNQNAKENIASTSTTDYVVEKQNNKRSKSKSPSTSISVPKNEVLCLQKEEGGGMAESHNGHPSPLDTPITPEYQRTFSANMRYVESMRDEYRQNMYKRSRYIGESMDFENDFEDLREQTRHFRRSRSKSRSPILEEGEPCTSRQAEIAARRKLQDKILDEITRTTINYQDFSRDMNKTFIDFERRTSDSALIQKPEIMIQIDDECKRGSFYDDNDNIFEDDEYHHFRRFSINQEHQDNDFIYLQNDGLSSCAEPDKSVAGEKYKQELDDETPTKIVDIFAEDSDHAEADDIDSESEDDRQTVVEVEDEIDEDIWDYERPEEYNEQSECEEAEREMDMYANKNADDWNDEGAAGGYEENMEQIPNFEEDTISIDKMYNDAVKSTEELGIQEDYETIVKAINEEGNDKFRNSYELSDSVKTEDFLDEILREDENRYKLVSPRRDKIEATRNFMEHELNEARTSSTNGTKSTSISSTRLRSRYGLGPSPVNIDNLDSINVDLNYKPKKEYNWRKNFKLDDDALDAEKSSEMPQTEKCSDMENDFKNTENLALDEIRSDCEALLPKTSREGEIPASSEISELNTDFNTTADDHFETNKIEGLYENKGIIDTEMCDKTAGTEIEIVKEISSTNADSLCEIIEIKANQSSEHKESGLAPELSDETEIVTKKKKIKRKTRKESKGSIGGEDDTLEFLQNDNIGSNDTGAKRKLKKKNKSRDIASPNTHINSPSPANVDILEADNLNTPGKSKSSSSPTNMAVLDPDMLNTQTPIKLEGASKSPENLTVISSDTQKSNSRSPEPVKSTGPKNEPDGTSPKPQIERNDPTGFFDLIKDGSMYPLF